MKKITLAAAFEAGKGVKLSNGLWYYEGSFYTTGHKGAVPVKAVNQSKLKAEHALTIETVNTAMKTATVTVKVLASPAGMTGQARRDWVKRFAAAARIQARPRLA